MNEDEEPLLTLDPTCPYCRKHSNVGEIFDGHGHDCYECGKYLVAVAYDGTMVMAKGDSDSTPPLTGKQRTRKLWNKRGRQ